MTQVTTLSLASQSETSPPGVPKQIPLALAIILALGAIILIWSEIWILATVLFWAIASVLHATGIPEIILGVVIFAPSIWASWFIARLAVDSERTAEPVFDHTTSLSDI